MASRWNRNAPYGGGYMGSGGVGGMGFYMGGPPDRRPYNIPPAGKPFYGGYRDDSYNRRPDRRDDMRGGKRGPPKAHSPSEKRHLDNSTPRRDHRPFGKRSAPFGKYEVRIPKTLFNLSTRSATSLRHDYPRLSVASDFYECSSNWVNSFPLHCPFKLGSGTDYHVFHRDVEPPTAADSSLLNPADADYSFSARVMLMACPQLAELYKSVCRIADEPTSADKAPPGKNLHFLVGGRAKSETMAIGGPWSPSLDGLDPVGDPKTLINTAIRTFRGYTGLDLSPCTEWIRFMEIKNYRLPDTKAPAFTGDDEERVIATEGPEVVVFFVPNTAHLVPTDEEWNDTKEHYSTILQALLNPETKNVTEQTNETTEAEASVADTTVEESEDVPNSDMEPTHYSKLDLNNLKVNELRNELAARKLDNKGLKVNLASRLQAALDEEKKADSVVEDKSETETKAGETPAKTGSPSAQGKEDTKELTEKDRRRLERMYRMSDKPVIVIHPNKFARGGRFDCHRVSLFSLLDYRTEDQKEQNFEVSLFAEQFNEMLQRDCAFTIFKAVHNAPEKEHKPERDAKTENGLDADDEKEPDVKRRKEDSQSAITEDEENKVRKIHRTVHPDLLFAFTYFDMGRTGYIREHDLCELLHLLDLRFSRAQMRKLVSKVVTRRDHVQYHSLTDTDIVQGGEDDVTNISTGDSEDVEVTKMLAMGNRALFETAAADAPAKIVVGGSNSASLLERVDRAEEVKRKIECQFALIKDELEKTRVQLNSFKDKEDALRAENHDLSSRLRSEQKQSHELKSLSGTYNHLLRFAREQLDRVLFDINKQFDKEKAKRDAEKAAAEAEKAKSEEAPKNEAMETETKAADNEDKSEEKEWEVVDTV